MEICSVNFLLFELFFCHVLFTLTMEVIWNTRNKIALMRPWKCSVGHDIFHLLHVFESPLKLNFGNHQNKCKNLVPHLTHQIDDRSAHNKVHTRTALDYPIKLAIFNKFSEKVIPENIHTLLQVAWLFWPLPPLLQKFRNALPPMPSKFQNC